MVKPGARGRVEALVGFRTRWRPCRMPSDTVSWGALQAHSTQLLRHIVQANPAPDIRTMGIPNAIRADATD